MNDVCVCVWCVCVCLCVGVCVRVCVRVFVCLWTEGKALRERKRDIRETGRREGHGAQAEEDAQPDALRLLSPHARVT